MIKWPKHIIPNSKTSQTVYNLDFLPTIQNIINPSKKAKILDGVDLTRVLTRQELIRWSLFFHFPLYLQAYKKGKDGSRDPLFRTRLGSVIISEQWKLNHYFEGDIGKKNNVAKLYPKKTSEHYKKLETWRLKTKAPIPTEKNSDYSSEFENKKNNSKL